MPQQPLGEGNGNPLQCSCLENPRDRRAWWAAIYGVTQSRTRLKWLSSSSLWHLGPQSVPVQWIMSETTKWWCQGLTRGLPAEPALALNKWLCWRLRRGRPERASPTSLLPIFSLQSIVMGLLFWNDLCCLPFTFPNISKLLWPLKHTWKESPWLEPGSTATSWIQSCL